MGSGSAARLASAMVTGNIIKPEMSSGIEVSKDKARFPYTHPLAYPKMNEYQRPIGWFQNLEARCSIETAASRGPKAVILVSNLRGKC